ncbi:hypothetical protein B9G54_07720 [Alloscardovia macacae]|uniref:Integrase catalytic domain-containing protein n=1 Tax=Alloscardovia macacae TaxID=1160091 RepID=A0A1Y2SWE6_9BIFI|nr:IS481 family transposase [Alloscardovia macacae]OTA25317.1 hypothetical protein B9G54_07720 [Alloscardovia macacae]OTA27888.1 hypothetical protein B9T39_07705 [Alloscardovia macacae]
MSFSRNRAIVFALEHTNMSVQQAAYKFDCSTRQIRRIHARYKAEGEDGLHPRSHATRSHPNQTPEAMVLRVIELHDQLDAQGWDSGARSIHAYLSQQSPDQTIPSVSTIWRILKRADRVEAQPQKRPRTSFIRFRADYPNETWQSDFTHWQLADTTDIEITTWIDDHSRFILLAQAFEVTTVEVITHTFLTASRRWGLPQSILTDNGLVYTTRLARGNRYNMQPNGFEQLLDKLHITAKHGRPYHPGTQGKVERYHHTLKKWLTAQPPAQTLEQLNHMLADFVAYYNYRRPHQSLDNQIPYNVYTATPKAEPQISMNGSLWRVRVDKVDTFGKVTLRWQSELRHLGVGRAHAHTSVAILVNENHATVVNTQTGEILGEFTLDVNKNYHAKNPK